MDTLIKALMCYLEAWVQFLINVFLISIIPVTVHNEPLVSSFQAFNLVLQFKLLGKDFSVCEMGKKESI